MHFQQRIRTILICLGILSLILAGFKIVPNEVYAVVTTTGTFPSALNNFQDNTIINAGDWNNIEYSIGERGTTSPATLRYEVEGTNAKNVTYTGQLTITSASTTNQTITNLWATNFSPTNASTTNLTISGNLWDTPLTTGSIIFAGGGGLLTQNNANLFWDNTNNRLGVGTTSPGNLLSVNSTGNVYFGGALTVSGNSLFQNATTTGLSVNGGTKLGSLDIAALNTASVITNANLVNSSLTVTAGTGLTGGGAISLGGSGTLNLSTPVSVANGGTGAATLTLNGALFGNGTGAIQATAQGGSNSVLTANAGAPIFSNSPTVLTITSTNDSTSNGTSSASFFAPLITASTTASGQVAINSNTGSIYFQNKNETITQILTATNTFSFLVASTTANEFIPLRKPANDITITKVSTVTSNAGTGVGVDFNINTATSIAGTAKKLFSSDQYTNNSTTGDDFYTTMTVPNANQIWFSTSAASGTMGFLNVTISYKIND